ncbi:MAG: hypothetical protein IJS00_02855 [Paludibacteraceae bacterium]|nr:hypothetical protein [Paludibacteraceae bacterium]
MKKIYAFLATALMSLSLIAAPSKVPTVADLAATYDVDNNVVLALYFDQTPCTDVVLVGTYNKWNTDNVDDLIKFEPLTGFDGWLVAEMPYVDGVDKDGKPNTQGKAVQLTSDGMFDWKYQTGDINAWINLGTGDAKAADIVAGYDDESDVRYTSAGAYIYEIAYLKKNNSPCVYVPKHKYTIVLFDPYCDDEFGNEFAPAIIGTFNSWAEGVPMNMGIYEGEAAYIYTIEDEEGGEFKFKEVNDTDWSNQIQQAAIGGSWADCGNNTLPVTEEDMTIVIDYSFTEDMVEEGVEYEDGTMMYKYTKCGQEIVEIDETQYEVTVNVTVPANAPEAGVEIIGTFDEWQGTEMTLTDGVYSATVTMSAKDQFKFREAGTWDNEIMVIGEEGTNGLSNILVNDILRERIADATAVWEENNHVITLDFSNADTYVWKANVTALPVVELNGAKARKVMIDGQLYIIRNNGIFNALGTQVK